MPDMQPPVPTPALQTWEDIERAARTDAALYRMVKVVRHGVPRDVAMIQTLLYFSEQLAAVRARDLDRLQNETRPAIRVP